jgi:hypothetical protein
MRRAIAAAMGVVYGGGLAFLALLFLGAGGHGVLFLPGTVLASPFIFLGAAGDLLAPIVWGTVGALSVSDSVVTRRRVMAFVVAHYLGIPAAIEFTRRMAPNEMELVAQQPEAIVDAFIHVGAVYVVGQIALWIMLLRGEGRAVHAG